MIQAEHSAIPLTFINLPFVIKIFVLSIFEWPFCTGFKVKIYSKTCIKWPLKSRQNIDLNDKWQLNDGQKYCRMLPLKHSAILLTCIK